MTIESQSNIEDIEVLENEEMWSQRVIDEFSNTRTRLRWVGIGFLISLVLVSSYIVFK